MDDEFFSKPKRRGKLVATVDTSVESTSVENSGGEEMEVGTRNDKHASSDEFAVKGNLKLFRISKPSRKILKSRGVSHLFPIQYLTFDSVYDGMDVIGQARELHVHVAYICCMYMYVHVHVVPSTAIMIYDIISGHNYAQNIVLYMYFFTVLKWKW